MERYWRRDVFDKRGFFNICILSQLDLIFCESPILACQNKCRNDENIPNNLFIFLFECEFRRIQLAETESGRFDSDFIVNKSIFPL